MEGSMDILPAIDILDGRAVRLVHGERSQKTDFGDPLDLVKGFADAGAPLVHVVDLSGAFDGTPVHAALIAKMARVVPLQVGGGLRTATAIQRVLDAGVARVILGTAAVEQPELLDGVPTEQLVVGVDIKNGDVAIRGWEAGADVSPGAFVDAMAARGVARILCTAVSRDGTLAGPDHDALRQVSGRGVAVIASGGVGTLAHLTALTTLPDVESVVVGKALVTGQFTYAEAVAAC